MLSPKDLHVVERLNITYAFETEGALCRYPVAKLMSPDGNLFLC